MKLKFSLSQITVCFIVLVNIVVSSNLNWGKEAWKGIIEVDGKGYYAYLPAVFIYHDLNFGFLELIENEKYPNPQLYYDYRETIEGKKVNKYYCGTALAEMPFFLLAHATAKTFGYDADGYSKPYALAVNIAALFYLFIGLMYLNLILNIYQISDKVRSLTLLASVFGTHLFYYTIGEPSMSHIYSFAFVAGFFYFIKQYFMSFQAKYLILSSIALGIITLIRPVNIIVLSVLPFAAGKQDALITGIRQLFRYKIALIISILCFAGFLSIQFVIYKISTGNFFVYSYNEEGFNFLSPRFFDILFSYKKGLFLYTPMLFFSLAGLYFIWKRSKFESVAWLGFFTIITYVFSSWWMWYYGGSFSSRVYVEFIPMFMILLATFTEELKNKLYNKLNIAMIVVLIVICQIQTYQYRYFQIHWSDMTKERYWDVFLRIDKVK